MAVGLCALCRCPAILQTCWKSIGHQRCHRAVAQCSLARLRYRKAGFVVGFEFARPSASRWQRGPTEGGNIRLGYGGPGSHRSFFGGRVSIGRHSGGGRRTSTRGRRRDLMLTLATCVLVAARHGQLGREAWSLGPCSAASRSGSQASGPLWRCGAAPSRACGIGGRGRWTPRGPPSLRPRPSPSRAAGRRAPDLSPGGLGRFGGDASRPGLGP
jgi:hypothetical protein